MFSEIKVFKCFLCACVANDAGHEATGGPPQELAAKQLVIIYIYFNRFWTHLSTFVNVFHNKVQKYHNEIVNYKNNIYI